MSKYILYCGECSYAKDEDVYGYMYCKIMDGSTHCSNLCHLSHEALTPKQTAKLLHIFQKWRMGGKGKMPNPYIIGAAIDNSIRILRQVDKK